MNLSSKEFRSSIPSTSNLGQTQQQSQTLATGSSENVHPTKKPSYHRVTSVRLPTPPPDPTGNTATPEDACKSHLEKERDLLEYINSVRNTVFNPAIVTGDAFDHLDKLYKLMEQMLDLREQNQRLQRRVRDLEYMKNLEKMHRTVTAAVLKGKNPSLPEVDADSLVAENILDSILIESNRFKKSVKHKFSLKNQQQRDRSSSLGMDLDEPVRSLTRRVSEDHSPIKSKVSKWTKVKAAFKWEKASPTVSGAKSQDSGLGGMLPVNNEVACYLRVPSTSDSPLEAGASPADSIFSSYAAGVSTSGTLSSASSTEDLRCERREIGENTKLSTDNHHGSLDEDEIRKKIFCQEATSFYSIDESASGTSITENQRTIKSHKTPWGKVKEIIQTRKESLKKKQHRLSSKSDDLKIEEGSIESDQDDVFEEDTVSTPKTPTVILTVDDLSMERYQRQKSEENAQKTQKSSPGSPCPQRRVSKWTKVKQAFLTSPTLSKNDEGICTCGNHITKPCNNNSDLHQLKQSVEDHSTSKELQEEIFRNYQQLQNKLSIEFNEKIQEWERMKANSPNSLCQSSIATNTNNTELESKDTKFIKKMEEWEKIKSRGNSPTCKQRQIPMTCEENLAPEFKKKLQEWQKIKKEMNCSQKEKKISSVSTGLKQTPVMSEDFKKKLEEWKQIKAQGHATQEEVEKRKSFKEKKSPDLPRKDKLRVSKKIKTEEDRELQWLDKELQKIDREKQRLEKEREKFFEREEKLAKLRRSIMGSPHHKKEVLVQTPCGFYRFEGISRKFTQKLYEWEKAQGIGPEESTLAFLNNECQPKIASIVKNKPNKEDDTSHRTKLTRSKSVDSIVQNAASTPSLLMTHQPSSLSLNDVEELENKCFIGYNQSSLQNLHDTEEFLNFDEPEAVLVEVEDIIEETAAPLQSFPDFEEKHPVYLYEHQEEATVMHKSTKSEAPIVRRSESVRAQANYNLIQESIETIYRLSNNEEKIQELSSKEDKINGIEKEKSLLELYTTQIDLSNILINKVRLLQEANSAVTSPNDNDDASYTVSHLCDVVEMIQDLSAEVVGLSENMHFRLTARKNEANDLKHIFKALKAKITELKRCLSYLCAASDMTAPGRRKKSTRHLRRKKSLDKPQETRENTEDSTISQQEQKTETSTRKYSDIDKTVSTGAIKRKTKPPIEPVKSDSETDDENMTVVIETPKKLGKHKKLLKTRRISDTYIQYDSCDNSISSPKLINNLKYFIVPTNKTLIESPDKTEEPTTATVFVKTTRKLFTPIGELDREPFPIQKPQHTQRSVSLQNSPNVSRKQNDYEKSRIQSPIVGRRASCLPPLPRSPTPQRKDKPTPKEISPNIRIMLARYNQKLSGQESLANKSGGSSGSASPVAWRSPVFERRVKAQTERYEEELNKSQIINNRFSPLLGGRREVKKSASVGVISLGNKQMTVPHLIGTSSSKTETPENSPRMIRGILKSSSADVIKTPKVEEQKSVKMAMAIVNQPDNKKQPLPTTSPKLQRIIPIKLETFHHPTPTPIVPRADSQMRAKKIKQAKEAFLMDEPCPEASSQEPEDMLKFPARSRLSQISVGSESSFDSQFHPEGLLVKSASAGMINVDRNTYKQFEEEGYVSLPRTVKQTKTSKFGLSSITSKFRKIKMRRSKDKMNAVSTLCRQSLVVDIQCSSKESLKTSDSPDGQVSRNSSTVSFDNQMSSSEEAISSSSRGGGWRQKSNKIFKK